MADSERVEELRRIDADITAELKKPLVNIHRALLVTERRDIREELKRLEVSDAR